MAYPATRLVRVVEIAPGADLTADPATWTWIDISAYLIVASPITIGRGRTNESSTVGPSRCELRLRNTDSRFTPHHPAGAYFPNWRRGTPLRVRVNPGSGLVTRFTGFVDEISPAWPTGRTSWSEVGVVAQGILRRLGQSQTLDSALRRALLHDASSVWFGLPVVEPVAYWPMEDESKATKFGSAVVGPPPIVFSNMRPSADTNVVGSLPLPVADASASFVALVPAYPPTTEWAIRWTMRLPAAPSVKTTLMSWNTFGSIATWALTLTPQAGQDVLNLDLYDAAGTLVWHDLPDLAFALDANSPELYDEQLYFEVSAWQDGADIRYNYRANVATDVAGQTGIGPTGTVGNIFQVSHAASPGFTTGGYTVGHVAVAANQEYLSLSSAARPASGFLGEQAYLRFDRLCNEEMVGHAYDTASTADSRVGPQQHATLLELLHQAEAAESGLLWETTDGKLMFRSRDKRYNRTVALALDIAQKHVKLPLELTEDDQRLRNDVTVSRTGGSTARYSNVDVRDGTYTQTLSLNLADDVDLLNHASWRVHAGTADEMRVSALPLNFQSNPGLIPTWLVLDIGDWITVANLPPQYPPGSLGAVLEGYTETIDAVHWWAVLNVSPSRPWEVFQVEHARLGRVDTDGSQLTAAVSAGATSLSVQTTSGPRWITSTDRPQDFPPTKDFSIEAGGWEIPVSAITTPGPTFVGVGAAAAANAASVTPALPGGIVAGDLLLCWAGNRNDATGGTTLPAGWTTLVDFNFGTARLFGKIATGSDTAPTIAFTGVAAGDTTLAQCAAFRNVTLTVVSRAQLNASAQNVAYPGLGMPANSLALYLGWKPSAWTSVATIAGATEIGEPSSALGSGMGLVWDYLVSATPAAIQAGSFVVTGGVAAASRGAVATLAGSEIQTFTVTAVPGALSAGTAVRLWKPGVAAL